MALVRSWAVDDDGEVAHDGPPRLSQTDTLMWTIEADPLLRSTIAAVLVLDAAPDRERVLARVRTAVERVPQLRHRVERAPLHPTVLQWVPVGHVDLDYHVRHVVLPEPGTLEHLLELVRVEYDRGLDRERPLWEFLLVDGLEGGRAAFVVKAHHLVTDGIGAMQLSANLFDLEPDPVVAEASDDGSSGADARSERTGWFGRWLDAAGHDVEVLAGTVDGVRTAALPAALRAVRDPIGAVGDALETARSVARVVAPAFDTRSPLMTARGLTSGFHAIEVGVDRLRAAARSGDATVNDAFLAGVTGGLRRYHERHGVSVGELRMAMPVSLRDDGHEAGGNHITVLRTLVPVGTADPAERLAAIRSLGRRLRSERSLPHTEVIAAALNAVPSPVIGSIMKHVDVLVSNVPGLPVPMYLAGREVQRMVPFGPTGGAALNLTLVSYRGTCGIGVHRDVAAIPDGHELVEDLRSGFDEVLALGDTESG